MIKAIILDLDGTLANTIDDITDGLNGMLTEYGFPNVTTTDTLNNINNGALELVRRSLPADHRDDEFTKKAKKTYEKYYSDCYCNKTLEYPGISSAIKKLEASGVSLSVLSNKQDEFVKVIVKKLFKDVKFDFVIGQGSFTTKPDPTSVNYILSNINVQSEHAVIVGDSNVDMITAKNANIKAVGVSWGYRSKEILIENGAEIIIDTPDKLVEIINI